MLALLFSYSFKTSNFNRFIKLLVAARLVEQGLSLQYPWIIRLSTLNSKFHRNGTHTNSTYPGKGHHFLFPLTNITRFAFSSKVILKCSKKGILPIMISSMCAWSVKGIAALALLMRYLFDLDSIVIFTRPYLTWTVPPIP